jgi:heme/copper-type cytochrome/quinol oxidase subunit 2
MSEVGHETRSTIILFIAILLAVIITVWLILSFDRPNYKNSNRKQVGYNMPMEYGHYTLLQNNLDFS